MRIIDKRGKDYYDGTLLSLYHDSDLLFIRPDKTHYYKINEYSKTAGWEYRGNWNWGTLKESYPFGNAYGFREVNDTYRTPYKEYIEFIGFCGVVYPLIKRYTTNKDGTLTITYRYESIPTDRQFVKQIFNKYNA